MTRRAAIAISFLLAELAAPARGDTITPRSLADEAYRKGIAQRGNDLLARPHFGFAARTYARLLKEDGESVALRRMEGNAWLLAGNRPEAIAAYRRGLTLEPDDPDMLRGLEYARSRVAFAQPEDRDALIPRPQEYALPARFLRRWGLIALMLTSVLGWLALARWIVTRRPRWLAVSAGALALTAALAAGWLLERDHRRGRDAIPFALTTRTEILRRGGGSSFLPRRDSPLPAGVEVTVHRERGGWRQVELADGTLGWLPAASLLRSTTDG